MSEMVLKGEIPNGAKVIIEANDKEAEELNEEESIGPSSRFSCPRLRSC